MNDTLYITVAKPCHENCDKMAPAEQGRFCQSCNKQVIDFTKLSDTEIIQLLSQKTTGTCGRFTQGQLNTPIQAPASRTLPPKLSIFLAAFVSVFLLINEATAQEIEIMGKVAHVEQRATPMVKGDTILSTVGKTEIKGVVKDMDGQPIAGATVALKGTKTITSTDTCGSFSMLALPNSKNILVVSSVGFATKELILSTDTAKQINVRLEMQMMMLGEVVVIKPKKVKAAKKTAALCGDTVPRQQTTRNRIFSVYPNPAVVGTDIKISFQTAGQYSVQLLDISGKVHAAQSFKVRKSNNASMSIPESVTTGTYILNVVQNGSGNTQSEKIVLQR